MNCANFSFPQSAVSDFISANTNDEGSHHILKDCLQHIFDSHSDFWTRAPWMSKKEDVRRVFQSINEEIKGGKDGSAEDVFGFEMNSSVQRHDSIKDFSKMKIAVAAAERPVFMNSEPLLQFHVDRPEQTGSSTRFMYYDSEITSVIRYAHCSDKFASSTMDIIRSHLFPYNSHAVILEEATPLSLNVGIEWETLGCAQFLFFEP